jgi:hypothetical protein
MRDRISGIWICMHGSGELTATIADEDGLAPPFDGDAIPLLKLSNVDLEGGEGEHVSRRIHLSEELDQAQAPSARTNELGATCVSI